MLSNNSNKKIEILYNKYRNLMYSEAFKILKEQQLAEDAVQQAFIKIIKYIENIGETNDTKTKNLLKIICRNVAINLYNQKRQNKIICFEDIEETLNSDSDEINNIIIDNERVREIVEAIDNLPVIYRDTIILEKMYKYSVNEISDIFGVSVEAVYKRSARARNLLMKILKKDKN